MSDDERKKYIGFGCFAQCDQVKIECVDCTVHRECLEEWKRVKANGNERRRDFIQGKNGRDC